MKKITILIIFILNASLNLYSQNSFQTIIESPHYHLGAYDVIQTNNSDYIIVGFKANSAYDTIGGYLAKISKYGKLIAEKDTFLTDTIFGFFSAEKLNNGNFITYAILEPQNIQGHNVILFNEYSPNLDLIQEHKIKFPIDTVYVIESRLKAVNGNYYLNGYANDYTKNKGGSSFIYKFNGSLDSMLFVNNTHHYVDIKGNNTQTIYAAGTWIDNSFSPIVKMNESDLTIDTVYDFGSILGGDNMFFGGDDAQIEFLTDSTFLYLNTDQREQLNMSILDTAINIKYNIAFGNPDYQDFPLEIKSISFLNQDSIYVGSNFPFSAFYSIALFDSQLNIRWEKFIEIPNSFVGVSIVAANNGGCLLLVELADGKKKILALKLDSHGNLPVSVPEISDAKMSELIIYPNPGTAQITVRTASQALGGEFVLCDISGKTVFQTSIKERFTSVSTDALPEGVYVYKYVLNGTVKDTGKWVKAKK